MIKLINAGADVLIGGFIIGGSQAKTVVVRARGPSLTAAGVPGALQNPLLQLLQNKPVRLPPLPMGKAGLPPAADALTKGLFHKKELCQTHRSTPAIDSFRFQNHDLVTHPLCKMTTLL